MRIIAGTLGGRVFASPQSHRTHPMSDRVRGALFNTLGDIQGLSVLDPFAGSGALGFEAVSRGAREVLLIENDTPAQVAIAGSIEQLGIAGSVRLIRANCSVWSERAAGQLFDIVLCDPPYDNLRVSALQKMTGHVAPGGIFVLSWPGKQALPKLGDVDLIEAKSYGDAQLAFYRR